MYRSYRNISLSRRIVFEACALSWLRKGYRWWVRQCIFDKTYWPRRHDQQLRTARRFRLSGLYEGWCLACLTRPVYAFHFEPAMALIGDQLIWSQRGVFGSTVTVDFSRATILALFSASQFPSGGGLTTMSETYCFTRRSKQLTK